jgi:hypothetical protein
MTFTKFYTAICFLAVALIALAACSAQEEETVAETPVAQTTPTISPTKTAVPLPTATATPIPPTPTGELPTPTATATEPPATPVALCPGAVASDLAWACEEDSRDGVRYCTAVDPEQNLACYEDMDHPFALLLPANWWNDVTVYQRFTIMNRDQIVKDHDFIFYEEHPNGDGGTKLSIFAPRERSLTSWLIVKQRTMPMLFSITEPNIRVAGHPAALWTIDCSPPWYREIHIALHNGEYVFWWRHYAFNETGILALRQMLDGIRFGEETAVPATIPDDIWQEALYGCG